MNKALKKVLKLKSNKKALNILFKKVNLLKEGLKKVHPVKKWTQESVSTQKSELKKSSKNWVKP